MPSLPLWLQVTVALILLSAFVRPQRISSTSIGGETRAELDSLWRRFNAIRGILAAQSRRFGEIDATIGVVAVFELTAAFWFFDKAYGSGAMQIGPKVIAWLMALPVLIAITAMQTFAGEESPDAAEFIAALEQDETKALREAIAEMADDFANNQSRLRAKAFGMKLAVGVFGALLLADCVARMLGYWGIR